MTDRWVIFDDWGRSHSYHATEAEAEPIYVKRSQADQCYRYSEGDLFTSPWPYQFDGVWSRWHPWRRPTTDRVTALVKAGAMIAAEIDRLQRAAEGQERTLGDSDS